MRRTPGRCNLPPSQRLVQNPHHLYNTVHVKSSVLYNGRLLSSLIPPFPLIMGLERSLVIVVERATGSRLFQTRPSSNHSTEQNCTAVGERRLME
ncbi:hypothetical protein Mapa_008484 [Marchantia paleacea]|nr:hypothetical protein Mapa_008484 [Marchantia paleacea]